MKIYGDNGYITIPALENFMGFFGEKGPCHAIQLISTKTEYGTMMYYSYRIHPTNINFGQIKRETI